jgi:crossover junction endodeoxyribonuclease RuvC
LIVLGVDPGIAITGYGVVESAGDRLVAVDYGCFVTSPDAPVCERLRVIYDDTKGLVNRYSPDAIAVERLFFCRNTTTAMTVGEARGAVLVAAALSGAPVHEYTPMQVKQAVTGYGKADKRQVQAMVKALLGLEVPPSPDDVADALAVAVACIHTVQTIARLESCTGIRPVVAP